MFTLQRYYDLDMAYESVDALQRALAKNVFHYTKDAKKAAGRALGTLVEIVTFYLLKNWGLERFTAIERRLPEYANPDITHNVEFSLHPSQRMAIVEIDQSDLPITPTKLAKKMGKTVVWPQKLKQTQLLSSALVLRNACVLWETAENIVIAYLEEIAPTTFNVSVNKLAFHPFAVLECKRVGVEEGVKKGPQTIEKAKQGAYVARAVSSLQKIRMSTGKIYGILDCENEGLICRPYAEFLQNVVASNDPAMLKDFTLTVGVVSNHGNWFTSDDHNKELKVLAQSYDWLLFLSDEGLSAFVDSLLTSPASSYEPIRTAFLESYSGQKHGNKFTKVRIDLAASLALQEYFDTNISSIEEWFNVISPAERDIAELKDELSSLAGKKWQEILS